MLNKESIYVILFSIPVYQLLFYTIQLISFKRKNPSKRYLGILLLNMTLFLVINAIHFLGYRGAFAYLYVIYLPLLLSIAPAFFLYILSITRDNHDVDRRQRLILFSPAILMLLANLMIVIFSGNSILDALTGQDLWFRTNEQGEMPSFLIIFWIVGIILVFLQITFAINKVLKIMMKEAEIMRESPAHLAYLEWSWIIGISISVLIFIVVNSLVELILPLNHLGVMVVYNAAMLLSGGFTGYLGMKQDTLLNQVEKLNLQNNAEVIMTDQREPEIAHVRDAGGQFMTDKEAEEIKNLIYNYLEKEKPYIRTDFSMHELCTALNLSRRKTSYVLNEVIRKNFYGVVNEYRIKEAESLLMQEDLNQIKIEVLGEMVGFQSKSSFNACFKKVTGMTPSEYRSQKRSY